MESVIERGLKVTKLDTFIAIANALDVSADTLSRLSRIFHASRNWTCPVFPYHTDDKITVRIH